MISPTRDWRHHERRVCESGEYEHRCQGCYIPPPRKPTHGGSLWIAHDIHARGNRQQADIVVRASANAIEAKRAVEIAGLTRQIKIRLAKRICKSSRR